MLRSPQTPLLTCLPECKLPGAAAEPRPQGQSATLEHSGLYESPEGCTEEQVLTSLHAVFEHIAGTPQARTLRLLAC